MGLNDAVVEDYVKGEKAPSLRLRKRFGKKKDWRVKKKKKQQQRAAWGQWNNTKKREAALTPDPCERKEACRFFLRKNSPKKEKETTIPLLGGGNTIFKGMPNSFV